MIQISCQDLQNITKIAPKIDAKFLKNRGCGADTFLERSWAPKGRAASICDGPFWELFSIKNQKKASKKAMSNSMLKKY